MPRLQGVTIEGLPEVTGRIHVDQFGYLPGADKVAVISDPRRGYNAMDSYTPGDELQVRSQSDGEVVYRGPVAVWNNGEIDPHSSVMRIWHERFNYHTPHAPNPPPG